MDVPLELVDERYCKLSTQGRVTGRRHTAELWFVTGEGGVYLMSGSGGLTQWCLNLQMEGRGTLKIDEHAWDARVAFLEDDDADREDALVAFHDKYDTDGQDRLDAWRRRATVVHLVLVRELQ